jgi:hypothetical protein
MSHLTWEYAMRNAIRAAILAAGIGAAVGAPAMMIAVASTSAPVVVQASGGVYYHAPPGS